MPKQKELTVRGRRKDVMSRLGGRVLFFRPLRASWSQIVGQVFEEKVIENSDVS